MIPENENELLILDLDSRTAAIFLHRKESVLNSVSDAQVEQVEF
ncbi:hypothetical protein VIBR0546_06927 [Vibrio brasiliensis LMG 20546]|uniref:Uncharacterized protein n=1 Tax=Vibrio brasiliensis LMG 20546 TaxID=945543 RepID=E8LXH3_9VIBR|nr:hypothetical protein VIBR0546_06927 [Vibrio brasiliensis LMG 20546]